MTKVIFDSSFLMAIAERPTTWSDDISREVGRVEPVALDCVVTELERIASGHGRRRRTARVAMEIAAGFERARCGWAGTDEEIMSAASTMNAAVATLDGELAESLLARHVKVISMRSGRAASR